MMALGFVSNSSFQEDQKQDKTACLNHSNDETRLPKAQDG